MKKIIIYIDGGSRGNPGQQEEARTDHGSRADQIDIQQRQLLLETLSLGCRHEDGCRKRSGDFNLTPIPHHFPAC